MRDRGAELACQGHLRSGGVQIAYEVTGAPGQDSLLLVHGYPDSRRIWDPLVGRMAGRFRLIRYDVRGAGESSAPRRLADYRLSRLEDDLIRIIDALSPGTPVHLVAHDWGSIQSWEAVTGDRLAGRLASFTSISGACLDHVGHWLRDCWLAGEYGPVARQLLSSWYIGLFHLPWLAPGLWQAGLGRRWPDLIALLEKHRPPTDPHQLRQGRFGVNLYRANVLPRLLAPRERHARVPVHLIEPEDDPFVSPALSESLERWVPSLRRTRTSGGHLELLSDPGRLARLIEPFVTGPESERDQA